jgi:hypothetical protein
MNLRMSQDRVKRFGWARARHAYAIYLAARDPRVPWECEGTSFSCCRLCPEPYRTDTGLYPDLGLLR